MMLLMMLLNKNRLLDDTSRDFDDRKTTKISIPLFFLLKRELTKMVISYFSPFFVAAQKMIANVDGVYPRRCS